VFTDIQLDSNTKKPTISGTGDSNSVIGRPIPHAV
jgi:hypothetical protein